jgi:hypothetical protein
MVQLRNGAISNDYCVLHVGGLICFASIHSLLKTGVFWMNINRLCEYLGNTRMARGYQKGI